MVKWGEKFVGELFDFKNGLNKGKEYFGRGTPIINYMDVYKKDSIHGYELRGRVDLTLQEIKRFEIRKGDVFFTRTSETPEEVGITCVLLDNVEDGVFSGFILRGRPITDELDINYCKYCFQTAYVRSEIVNNCTYTTRALTNGTQLSKIIIPLPPLPEQKAIAAALSDVDAYIEALEQLIAKKRNIKKGTMQELLTGKRRLPGFDGEWEEKKAIELGDIITGSTPRTSVIEYWGGDIPWVTPTDITSARDIYSSERLITEKGLYVIRELPPDTLLITCIASIGKNAILRKRGASNQQINAIVPFESHNIDFLYYLLEMNKNFLLDKAGQTATKILSKTDFSELTFLVPQLSEQVAIAEILSDMDAEIDALTAKLDKMRNVKKGMMQELLTGRIRLVAEAVEADSPPVVKDIETIAKLPQHSHEAYIDAVILVALVDAFGTEQHPFTAFDCQKFPYLFHRHIEGKAEGFKKFAAGPYNPAYKYKTARPIALRKKYIREHVGLYKGFVSDSNAQEALAYFAQWYGDEPLQWLQQFRYIPKRKDELELLTTTDKAMVELLETGKTVNLQTVKDIIKKSPAWRDKLRRPIFSDENIVRAIKWSNNLFGTEG